MKLREYQVNRIIDLLTLGRAYLWADVGAGKTVIALTAALRLIKRVRPFLVIAPKLVAQTVWHAEVNKWAHLHDLKLVVIEGPAKLRLQKLSIDADIYVINYELMPWLDKNVKICDFFDGLVLDEISRLKTPNKRRWRTVLKLADSARVVWGLTGTPLSLSLLDLFGQFRMIHPDALGYYITHYKEQYFYQADRDGWVWRIRPGCAEQIYERIKPYVVRVSADEQVKATPTYTNLIEVPMQRKVRQNYNALRNEFIWSLDEDTVIVAENAGVLTGKLSQFTGGGLYSDNEYLLISEHKYNALDELLESLAGRQVLIVYAFKAEARTIRQRHAHARWLGHEPCSSKALIEMWNNHALTDMRLLIHPASAGHGLNLQAGGHHVIWFGGTWSQEMYRQVNGRLARSGQVSLVTIHHLLCPNTVDTVQYAVMKGRMGIHESLINALS